MAFAHAKTLLATDFKTRLGELDPRAVLVLARPTVPFPEALQELFLQRAGSGGTLNEEDFDLLVASGRPLFNGRDSASGYPLSAIADAIWHVLLR